jgi:hypothetical protein
MKRNTKKGCLQRYGSSSCVRSALYCSYVVVNKTTTKRQTWIYETRVLYVELYVLVRVVSRADPVHYTYRVQQRVSFRRLCGLRESSGD